MKRWLRRIFAGSLGVLLLVVALAAWVVYTDTGTRVLLTRLATSLSADVAGVSGSLGRQLRIERFAIDTDGVEISGTKLELKLQPLQALRRQIVVDSLLLATLRIQLPPPKEPQQDGPLLPEIRLPLEFDLKSVSLGQLQIANADSTVSNVDAIELSAQWHGDALGVQRLTLRYTELALAASGRLRFAEPFDHQFDASWSLANPEYSGSGTLSGDLDETQLRHTLQLSDAADNTVETEVTLGLRDASNPRFAGNTHWQQLPVSVTALSIGPGRLEFDGTPAAYQLRLAASARHSDYGPASLEARAHGDLQTLTVDAASARIAEGNVDVAGNVGLTEGDWFAGTFAAVGLNPATVSAALTGALDLAGGLRVTRVFGVDLVLERLGGTLNTVALAGSGRLTLRQDSLQVESFELQAGPNRLNVSGAASMDSSDLQFELDAPKTALIWPPLVADIAAAGRLSGSLAAPVIDADLRATDARFEDWQLTETRLRLQPAAARTRIDFALGGLVRAGRELGALRLGGVADRQSASTTLEWELGQDSAEVDVTLARTTAGVSGTLSNGAVVNAIAGDWRQDVPAAFAVADDAVSLAPHCWRRQEARLCIGEFAWSADERRVRANTRDLPLALFQGLLPAGLAVTGSADAAVDVFFDADGWRGDLNWQQSDTLLRSQSDTQAAWQLGFDVATVNGSATGEQLEIVVLVQSPDDIEVTANVRVDDALDTGSLSGDIAITVADVAPFLAFLPELTELGGRLETNTTLGGTLAEPRAAGEVAWREGKATMRASGAAIKDATLVAELDEDGSARVDGELHAGDGSIRLTGSGSKIWNAERRLELELQGQDFAGLRLPEYTATLSPDLKLLYADKAARVTGRLTIPTATLAPASVPPTAVRISPDIVVHREGVERVVEAAVPLTLDLVVALGDAVTVSSFGLDGRLGGELRIRQTPGEPPAANGTLRLIEGIFKAYGQSLSINRGRLVFGGPLDNPALDIEATRNLNGDTNGSATVGLRIGGTARRPTTSLFSNPVLTEADALALLLTGRRLNDIGKGEGQTLTNAAYALGLSSAAPITRQIASSVGLDELAVSGGPDDAAVSAGASLGDKVFVRYTYGLFSRLGGFLLRYDLNKRFSLEAQTGEDQSLEVIYTVDR